MKRVLIVDDEKSFLLSLQDGLSSHSDKFQVLTAENGREAISVLQASPIDLLVTDLKMPEMDGFELLAWVSRERRELPVIVMTAFGTADIEARLAKMDTLQYLEKPLDLKMLQDSILNGLDAGAKSYIRGITLATFLQLMRVEQKNCTLKVTSEGQVGYLYVRRGELLDAEFADKSGEAAAMEIVAWENAEIEMDGLCRRQETVISLSMEHILIEAFRRKDEQVHQAVQAAAESEASFPQPNKRQNDGQQGLVTNRGELKAQEITRKRLLQFLQKNRAITEYIIFDQSGFPEEKNSGKCSIEQFDAPTFAQLVDQFDQLLGFGPSSFQTFGTSSRHYCLLFRCQQHRVLVKLLSEVQPRLLVREIISHVSRK